MFINNEGGGFADYIEIAPATTISQLFQSRSICPSAAWAARQGAWNTGSWPPIRILQPSGMMWFTPT
jgi:hypothetical protein